MDPLKVHDTAQLHDLALISPWTPIAVTGSEAPGFPAILGAWRADPRLAGLVVLKDGSITAPHSALHAAVRAAGAPPAEVVAKWIHLRTGSERLGNTIFEELVDEESSWRQTRYDRFKKEGPLTAHGWQDVFRLTQALSHPDDSTIDAIAGTVDRCVRTLGHMPKRRMGMSLTLARTAFGWRWAVEHILRLHGYMKESEPVALAPGLPSAEEVRQVWRHYNRRKALGA